VAGEMADGADGFDDSREHDDLQPAERLRP
jgi:hypothetical protein